jgi:hypothetical protein
MSVLAKLPVFALYVCTVVVENVVTRSSDFSDVSAFSATSTFTAASNFSNARTFSTSSTFNSVSTCNIVSICNIEWGASTLPVLPRPSVQPKIPTLPAPPIQPGLLSFFQNNPAYFAVANKTAD